MSDREVVITGTGLTTPIGKNVEENWRSIEALDTGISHNNKNDVPDFFQYSGTVAHYDLPEDIPPKQQGQMKFLNRGALLGFCAAAEAVSHMKSFIPDITPGRRALYVASGDHTKIGYNFMHPAIHDSIDMNTGQVDQEKLNSAALNKVNPFFLLESLNNNLFSFLSAVIGFMGPNTSLASLSPCGGNALELAYRSIKQDNADVALAVGYGNWITEVPVYELEGLGMLSRCMHGARSFKPFDRHRDGFIPGEGGAAIFLEAADSARLRGAQILGRIKEVGNYIEFSSNHTMGVADAVTKHSIAAILRDADLGPGDLGFMIPHGSGTRKGDRSELRSIAAVSEDHAAAVPLCGLKPYTGHMGAASDIAEVIYGMHALKHRIVPATLNFQETEREFSSMKISGSAQTCEINRFLSISYGAGGQSSSVIVEGFGD
jgi:3-oxoacyl-[acyl-carrier-protein] synthase II